MSENGSRRVVEFDIDRYVRNSKKVDLTQRARRRPGWAGMGPGLVYGARHGGARPSGGSAAPAPTHWRPAAAAREDAMAPQPGEPAKDPA
jgi:hypothetical protein